MDKDNQEIGQEPLSSCLSSDDLFNYAVVSFLRDCSVLHANINSRKAVGLMTGNHSHYEKLTTAIRETDECWSRPNLNSENAKQEILCTIRIQRLR